ncbi:MAG: alpha/beta fold hydrolase [Spirosomataceae bacterium]
MRKAARYFFGLLMAYVSVALLIWAFHPFVLFRPTPLAVDHEYHFSLPFREINFELEKGVRLNALWFPRDSTLNTHQGQIVLFFHGNRDNLARWGHEYAERFTSRGYNVLMYDYRGYGKSTGKRSEEALHRDAQYLYDFLKKQFSEDSIVVYGYSLGTGMASRAAADNRPRLLILEAPYVSIPTLGRAQLPIFPYEWLTRYKFRTDSCFAYIRCPIHLFHGTKDITVPYKNSLLLLATPTPKSPVKTKLTTIPGGHHLYLNSSPIYRLALDSLLK